MSLHLLYSSFVFTPQVAIFYLFKQRRSISQESRALADRCHNWVKIFLKSHFIKYLPLYWIFINFYSLATIYGCIMSFWQVVHCWIWRQILNINLFTFCFLPCQKKERIAVQVLERNHQSFPKSSMCPKMIFTGIV